MEEKPKSRLGRGLDALFAEEEIYVPSNVLDENESNDGATVSNENDQVGAGVALMPIEFIRPGVFQPRSYFDDQALDDLAASIKEHGVLQPLLVRPIENEADQFEIIAGERRWRAAQKAQLHEIPVIIQQFDDAAALEIGLIENLQREDLNSIEEAAGYARLMDQFGYTQEKLSEKIGKSRSYVANILRLLKLPSDVQALLKADKISTGHARALLAFDDPVAMAQEVIKKGLSVRELERLNTPVQDDRTSSKIQKNQTSSPKKPLEVKKLEEEMSNMLGLKVSIDGGASGVVTLHYKTLDQMDMILEKLSQ